MRLRARRQRLALFRIGEFVDADPIRGQAVAQLAAQRRGPRRERGAAVCSCQHAYIAAHPILASSPLRPGGPGDQRVRKTCQADMICAEVGRRFIRLATVDELLHTRQSKFLGRVDDHDRFDSVRLRTVNDWGAVDPVVLTEMARRGVPALTGWGGAGTSAAAEPPDDETAADDGFGSATARELALLPQAAPVAATRMVASKATARTRFLMRAP